MLDPELYWKHDEFGNCEELLSPQHKKKLDNYEVSRAGGDLICDKCGKKYYDHPTVLGALWLKELCNGDLVHL